MKSEKCECSHIMSHSNYVMFYTWNTILCGKLQDIVITEVGGCPKYCYVIIIQNWSKSQ